MFKEDARSTPAGGRSSRALMKLKTAAFAPVPMPSDTTRAAVSTGDLPSTRREWRRSVRLQTPDSRLQASAVPALEAKNRRKNADARTVVPLLRRARPPSGVRSLESGVRLHVHGSSADGP